MFTSSAIRSLLVVSAVATLASRARAQDSTAHDSSRLTSSELARRSAGSISFMQSRPQGAFGRNVGIGYGVNGAYLFRLDEAGIWSIRADAGILNYGNESRQTALSDAVGGRVQVDVKTSNYIVPLFVGPQLAWPNGPVRPYVNVGVGGQAFFTESHLEGVDGGSSVGSTTNHSEWTTAWTTGGGLLVPVYIGKTSVQLDLGMQYVRGGRASYLAPGSIVDLPGARIDVTPLQSTTHLVVIRIGARIGR
jgi:opacity protein-like surface antigen